MANFIAIDQYGHTIMIKKHPRKELLAHFGCKGIRKMYCDTVEGAKHIGYVVAGHWFSINKLMAWK